MIDQQGRGDVHRTNESRRGALDIWFCLIKDVELSPKSHLFIHLKSVSNFYRSITRISSGNPKHRQRSFTPWKTDFHCLPFPKCYCQSSTERKQNTAFDYPSSEQLSSTVFEGAPGVLQSLTFTTLN